MAQVGSPQLSGEDLTKFLKTNDDVNNQSSRLKESQTSGKKQIRLLMLKKILIYKEIGCTIFLHFI